MCAAPKSARSRCPGTLHAGVITPVPHASGTCTSSCAYNTRRPPATSSTGQIPRRQSTTTTPHAKLTRPMRCNTPGQRASVKFAPAPSHALKSTPRTSSAIARRTKRNIDARPLRRTSSSMPIPAKNKNAGKTRSAPVQPFHTACISHGCRRGPTGSCSTTSMPATATPLATSRPAHLPCASLVRAAS